MWSIPLPFIPLIEISPFLCFRPSWQNSFGQLAGCRFDFHVGGIELGRTGAQFNFSRRSVCLDNDLRKTVERFSFAGFVGSWLLGSPLPTPMIFPGPSR